MSQSLYTSMSGISAATTDLDVISNNVANIDTTGYKKSSVNFSDVYSTTVSSGSVATSTTGGTNPVQVGVGTQVSSISKDFSSGSAKSTGLSTDLMIQGEGFFTVEGTNDTTYYTRDGNFSIDSDGNLVTSDGYQVLGTSSICSSVTSKTTVSVPLSICATVSGTNATDLATESVSDLNGLGDKNFTSGDFNIVLTSADGLSTYTAKITGLEDLSTDTTMSQLTSLLQDGSTTDSLSGLNCNYTDGDGHTVAIKGITASLKDGSVVFDFSKATVTPSGGTETALSVGTVSYNSDDITDTTNFLTVSGLDEATLTSGVQTSNILDSQVAITELSSVSEAISKTGVTINDDGSLQVTYNDGSVLSVQLSDDDQNYEFVYSTVKGVQISGSKCDVSDDVAVPGNLVIQMATVTNTDGLMSAGDNLYKTGPNSGDVVYTIAGYMGCENVSSGYLESSNVDLSEELSNMILAQRAIQANSRVFTTTSDVLDTLVNMGR